MEIYYLETSTGVRVWNITWPDDMFEILTPDEFAEFQRIGARFGLHFFEAED